MKEYNIEISFKNGTINSKDIELVQNDYNSTTLNFRFDIKERVVLKILYPDNTIAYVNDVIDNKYTMEPGLLSQDGTYQIEFSAYDDNGKLTGYSTMEFYVRPELINTDEIIEPDDRVPILDTLINEVENINIDVEKVDNTTTVTLVKKDGSSESVEINDGVSGAPGKDGKDGSNGITPTIGDNGNWYLGDTDTGKPSRGTQGLPGPAGQDGTPGRDGYVQYTAGENIIIDENNVISSTGGNGTPDDVTTRLNPNDELETIGIYTQQNSPRKIWEGTLQQYNALSNKDNDTYYYITDDYSNNGLPNGGTSGQVLAKASNSDYDTEWISQHNFTHETWTFTLEDDTTINKEVVLW